MKSLTLGILLLGMLLAVVGCSGGPTTQAAPPLDQAAADAAKLRQGTVKSKGGGGVMPEPAAVKPGEHVGPPGPGPKATGS